MLRLLHSIPLHHEELAHDSDPQAAPSVARCQGQDGQPGPFVGLHLFPLKALSIHTIASSFHANFHSVFEVGATAHSQDRPYYGSRNPLAGTRPEPAGAASSAASSAAACEADQPIDMQLARGALFLRLARTCLGRGNLCQHQISQRLHLSRTNTRLCPGRKCQGADQLLRLQEREALEGRAGEPSASSSPTLPS